jgi:hypothetical protein
VHVRIRLGAPDVNRHVQAVSTPLLEEELIYRNRIEANTLFQDGLKAPKV